MMPIANGGYWRLCPWVWRCPLSIKLLAVTLPSLQRTFHSSATALQWVIDIYLLMIAVNELAFSILD